jgi:hypothetical protein
MAQNYHLNAELQYYYYVMAQLPQEYQNDYFGEMSSIVIDVLNSEKLELLSLR